MGRFTARRVLAGQLLLNPAGQVDERKLRPEGLQRRFTVAVVARLGVDGLPLREVPGCDWEPVAAVACQGRGPEQTVRDGGGDRATKGDERGDD